MPDTAFAQNYFVDHLTLSDLRTNGRIKVPPFQRGVVWTKNHRKEFIETVKLDNNKLFRNAPRKKLKILKG